MKVTIEYTKQHRCDERVTMIRILLLSRAEKGENVMRMFVLHCFVT